MKDKSIVLATDKDGNDITIEQVENWIKSKHLNKKSLSQFIYNRLYGRYIKPFAYNNSEYISKFKNGFTIMANCCLLIETYASLREKAFRDTNHKSERCFGWFFLKENKFSAFSKGGLSINDYIDTTKKIITVGVPKDFYVNVRCGILHNAETRNGWKVKREGVLCDEKTKTVNAVRFMNELESVISNYRNQLDNSDINDEVWINCINRIEDIIARA